ncbi:hypothetical protein KKB64_05035 [Patescibacteria group bacterium]|nr:hypothetical protein [Patescibacteria group bacterium]MBU1473116.1 hypothetical protein [Patescibacteria group bacterium]MBU2459652.1 hypothetical protein [Patescibacteria group bacterium]MBU2544445.1 hypothetical protein [Patescibacteria group bacterium]
MDDLIKSAQNIIDDAVKQGGASTSAPPPQPPEEPAPEPMVKPEEAPAVHEPSPASSPPPPQTVIVPALKNDEKKPKKKKSGAARALAVFLLLLVTVPVGAYFISQRNQQIADIRNRAAEIPGPYPPWSACDVIGDTTTSPKGNCLECKENTSGGPNPAWAPCGGTPECPWQLTNGQCCPKPPDNCSNPGDKICIPDPFISQCSEWDLGCPSGQQYYWKHLEGITSCDNFPTPTPTPGPTEPPGPQCQNIKIYKNGSPVDPSTLRAGDAVIIAVKGTNAVKARIRVNGGAWTETTTKNASGEYITGFTIPAGVTQFVIEAEVYRNGVWQ